MRFKLIAEQVGRPGPGASIVHKGSSEAKVNLMMTL
jgi:hypothetical protein